MPCFFLLYLKVKTEKRIIMLFTVDRLQLVNDQLIAFEFFNYEKEQNIREFNKEKKAFIKNPNFCDNYCGIGYNINKNSYAILESNFLEGTSERRELDWIQYQRWFTRKNNLSLADGSHSKPLSAASSKIGDSYVQRLLSQIHIDQYPGIDFSCDNSGLDITIKALNGNPTAGFDFDMYEPTENIVIEFLKRENPQITNLTAHPVRYPWNFKKFVSLWSATQRLKGTLYLVNYSDDFSETISVIEVFGMNDYGSIESDIGYKFTDRQDLLKWLKLMNTNVTAAKEQISKKPCQIRDSLFWDQYQKEETLVIKGEQKYNKKKKELGLVYL